MYSLNQAPSINTNDNQSSKDPNNNNLNFQDDDYFYAVEENKREQNALKERLIDPSTYNQARAKSYSTFTIENIDQPGSKYFNNERKEAI